MNKIKHINEITEKDINGSLNAKHKRLQCPSCKKEGIYVGCIESNMMR